MTEWLDISIACGYTLLIGFLLLKSKLVKQSGFPIYIVPLLFVVKCILSVVYTKLHLVLYHGGDSFHYFNDGNIIFQTLKENPLKYIYLTFGPNSSSSDFPLLIKKEILEMGFWSDTSAYTVVRFNAIVRLVSFGSFYTHGVFMSLISTLGLLWLYQAVCNEPRNKITWLFFAVPSVLFWTSGIHKEGLLIFTLGGLFLAVAKLNHFFSTKYLIAVVAFALGTFLIRDFIFYLLAPGWLAFWLSNKFDIRPIVIFVAVYTLIIIVGLWIPVSESGNYINMIVNKQQQFELLHYGNTIIDAPDYDASLVDIFAATPKAFINSLFGPLFLSKNNPKHFILSIDTVITILLWLALIAFSLNRPILPRSNRSTLWLVFFSLSLFIVIGLIVPNVGAIVRYRSIAIAAFTLALVSRFSDNKVIPLKKII